MLTIIAAALAAAAPGPGEPTLDDVRAATARFQNVEVALAEGRVPVADKGGVGAVGHGVLLLDGSPRTGDRPPAGRRRKGFRHARALLPGRQQSTSTAGTPQSASEPELRSSSSDGPVGAQPSSARARARAPVA